MTMQPTEYPDNLEKPTVSSPTCTALLCDDLKMDTGNLCDDPLYKAIDALYNRGWTDYHRNNRRHDPRGTREWQTILDMFRLQKRQLENKDT